MDGASAVCDGTGAPASVPAVQSALSAGSSRSLDEVRAIRSRKATRQLKKLPREEREKFFGAATASPEAQELFDIILDPVVGPNFHQQLKHQLADDARVVVFGALAGGKVPDFGVGPWLARKLMEGLPGVDAPEAAGGACAGGGLARPEPNMGAALSGGWLTDLKADGGDHPPEPTAGAAR